MLWWHSWAWWFGTYQWLEANNMWKSAVAFGVTLVLGALLSLVVRPVRRWREHKMLQQKIADRLDDTTPGGITALIEAVHKLTGDLKDGETPDDNGSDPAEHEIDADDNRKHFPLHSGRIEPGHNVIPDARGGSSASHR